MCSEAEVCIESPIFPVQSGFVYGTGRNVYSTIFLIQSDFMYGTIGTLIVSHIFQVQNGPCFGKYIFYRELGSLKYSTVSVCTTH